MNSSEQLSRLTFYADLFIALSGIVALLLPSKFVAQGATNEQGSKRVTLVRRCAIVMIVCGSVAALLYHP
jgi:hypothetical protein